jgi:hypothetical protein
MPRLRILLSIFLAISLACAQQQEHSKPKYPSDNQRAPGAVTEPGTLEDLAASLSDIAANLSLSYDLAQEAILREQQQTHSDPSLFALNWKLPQWPWKGDGDNHTADPPIVPRKRNPLTYSLDGHLEKLVHRHLQRGKKKVIPSRLRFVENSGVCGMSCLFPLNYVL